MNLARGLAAAGRALVLAGCALGALTAVAAPAANGGGRALVVLGDSLSAGYGMRVEEGWVALLEQRLAEQGYGYRVVNASISGETSAGGVVRLAHLLERHRPAVVVIELGANDGLRGLPVEALRKNLADLVARSRAAGARVLLVGTRLPLNYGPAYGEAYAASFAEVAHAAGVPLVPSLLVGLAPEERNFQADHLHPVAAVQPRLLDAVWPALVPLLGARPAPRSP